MKSWASWPRHLKFKRPRSNECGNRRPDPSPMEGTADSWACFGLCWQRFADSPTAGHRPLEIHRTSMPIFCWAGLVKLLEQVLFARPVRAFFSMQSQRALLVAEPLPDRAAPPWRDRWPLCVEGRLPYRRPLVWRFRTCACLRICTDERITKHAVVHPHMAMSHWPRWLERDSPRACSVLTSMATKAPL